MRTVLFVVAVGCASSSSEKTIEEPTVIKMKVVPHVAVAPAAAVVDTDTVVAEPIAVVRFTASTVVRSQPEAAATPLGVVAKGTRAEVKRELVVGDCRWIEIAPRGWLCDRAVESTNEAPTRGVSFALDADLPPPKLGTYGLVRGEVEAFRSKEDAEAGANGRALVGKNSVRAAGSTTIDGVRYWRTTRGELINASSIRYISPSRFRGVALLGEDVQMPAWVRSRRPIKTRSARGAINGELAGRAVVTILEQKGKRVRVGDDAWVSRSELRATTTTAPPEGTGADEKWFDIDLDEQVLVAYEGERPVYATMVSTGKKPKHRTPTVIARIATKHERTTMNNAKGDAYSVADVPWTMFYDRDYAVHTSYWHDGFGSERSHGCVNLSPHDARVLYHWSSPDVPPGWTTVYGNVDAPGSLVRVRSRRMPEPGFRGYAATLRANRVVAAN